MRHFLSGDVFCRFLRGLLHLPSSYLAGSRCLVTCDTAKHRYHDHDQPGYYEFSRSGVGPKYQYREYLPKPEGKLLLQKPYFVPYKYFGPFGFSLYFQFVIEGESVADLPAQALDQTLFHFSWDMLTIDNCARNHPPSWSYVNNPSLSTLEHVLGSHILRQAEGINREAKALSVI